MDICRVTTMVGVIGFIFGMLFWLIGRNSMGLGFILSWFLTTVSSALLGATAVQRTIMLWPCDYDPLYKVMLMSLNLFQIVVFFGIVLGFINLWPNDYFGEEIMFPLDDDDENDEEEHSK